VIALADQACIQADMEDVYRVYRSDAQVRLGPDDIPCTGYTFVIKRKTGMEIYFAVHAREIKRGLIYRVEPETRNIGDPSPQLKTGLDLLRGLGFSLDPVNLKFSPAMLEVVLQDVPVLMTPAKAKKQNLERTANLTALENQAAFLEEHGLLDASEQQLAKLPRDERNRYNAARTAYQKLLQEDHCDEQRERLFDHVDALLHGRKPPQPGARRDAEPAPEARPAPPPSKASAPASARPASAPSSPSKAQPPATPPEPKTRPATVDVSAEGKAAIKIVPDPKDKERIRELEVQVEQLQQRSADLEKKNEKLSENLLVADKKRLAAETRAEKLEDLEHDLEVAQQSAEDAQREIRRLKSENAKALRKIEELEEQLSQPAEYDRPIERPRSRLNTGRTLLSSPSSASYSSKPATDPPHVLRKPPPAGAIFGVDWDLDRLPCTSLDQVSELHQSICNAQLTLEGYPTQYCTAYIVILKENGGRQLYMVFNLPQEERFLIYKPIKKPSSGGELQNLLKEAHKFLQVCGIETEQVTIQANTPLPSEDLAELLGSS